MLLGILQDDDRFSIKRGFMVAVFDSESEIQFKSLTEELNAIVLRCGPITIKDIKGHLKKNRSVLDSTIVMMLNNSEEIVISSKAGHYHTVHEVIGDKEHVLKFNDCLEFCLLEGGKSLHFIHSNLERNHIFLQKQTVKSWLRKRTNFRYAKGIFSLTNLSSDLSRYTRAFNRLQSSGLVGPKLRDALLQQLENCSEQRFIQIDNRFFDFSIEPYDSSNVLESILEEFKF
jgi:RNA polymerase primary sigma factor